MDVWVEMEMREISGVLGAFTHLLFTTILIVPIFVVACLLVLLIHCIDCRQTSALRWWLYRG